MSDCQFTPIEWSIKLHSNAFSLSLSLPCKNQFLRCILLFLYPHTLCLSFFFPLRVRSLGSFFFYSLPTSINHHDGIFVALKNIFDEFHFYIFRDFSAFTTKKEEKQRARTSSKRTEKQQYMNGNGNEKKVYKKFCVL